jgi:hypothetical protein
MSNFLTRVELHDAKYEDYVKLHAAMGKEGFLMTITGGNGIVYKMPTAEYCKTGNYVLNDVVQSGKKAANTVGKSYEIIVGECSNLQWDGLPPVK